MKQLPKMNLELHTLFDIANGRIKTELLVTAIELKIFDHLTAPQSSKALAAQLETDPTYTRFLLDGLTAMKLIQKREGSYQNLPDVQIALHSESPTYVGAMFTMMDQAAFSATHERTRPEGYVLANMPWMFAGQDIMFDHGEIAEAMKAAGFSSVKSDIVGTPMMPMALDIARKGNHDE